MSNYKSDATASELVSALAICTGLAASWAYVSGVPVITLGSVAAGGGGCQIKVQDQRAESADKWNALPGFSTVDQPVYTSGVTEIWAEAEGFPSVATIQATRDVTFAALADTDTFKLNGRTWTAKTTVTDPTSQFAIAGSDTNAATNAAAKINQYQGDLFVATSLAGAVTITAKAGTAVAGSAGNLVPVRAGPAHVTVSGSAQFLGGGKIGRAHV